jgi:hypothetical protein
LRLHRSHIISWIRLFVFASLAWIVWQARSIEQLIPAFGIALAIESLARLALASAALDPRRHRFQACFGLAMSASIFFRPSYSILTLSFVLLLQIIFWLIGDGVFMLWGAGEGAGASASDKSEGSDASEASDAPQAAEASEFRDSRPLPPARRTLRALTGVLQIGFGIALQLSAGAGALDRQRFLALAFVILGTLAASESVRTLDRRTNQETRPSDAKDAEPT